MPSSVRPAPRHLEALRHHGFKAGLGAARTQPSPTETSETEKKSLNALELPTIRQDHTGTCHWLPLRRADDPSHG